ncbi:hypothetical protein WG66_003682 [Moniliophthora roreri]|nr:hypothetical protein WG66_003682 [Moniliophthora roreri]
MYGVQSGGTSICTTQTSKEQDSFHVLDVLDELAREFKVSPKLNAFLSYFSLLGIIPLHFPLLSSAHVERFKYFKYECIMSDFNSELFLRGAQRLQETRPLDQYRQERWGKPFHKFLATLDEKDGQYFAFQLPPVVERPRETTQGLVTKEFLDVERVIINCFNAGSSSGANGLQEGEDFSYDEACLIVVGHPGIGKTLFLHFLYHRRLCQAEPTVLIHSPDEIYMAMEKGTLLLPKLDFNRRRRLSSEVWTLFDSDEVLPAPPKPWIDSRTFLVYTASPRQDRWEWQKRNTAVHPAMF